MTARTEWHSPIVEAIDNGYIDEANYKDQDDGRCEVAPDEGNLISSLTTTGHHAPVLDIDVPARLVPSSTPGHHHLYIDVECSWEDYEVLLRAMERCGILEAGYVSASIERRMTSVRKYRTRPPREKAAASEGHPMTDVPPLALALAAVHPDSHIRHIAVKGHPLCDPGAHPNWYQVGSPGRICATCRLLANDLLALLSGEGTP